MEDMKVAAIGYNFRPAHAAMQRFVDGNFLSGFSSAVLGFFVGPPNAFHVCQFSTDPRYRCGLITYFASFQPVGFQLFQSRRDHLRGRARLCLDFLEAVHPHEQLAQDQHRPAIAHDTLRTGHRAERLVSSIVLDFLHHVFFIRLVTMNFIAIWGSLV